MAASQGPTGVTGGSPTGPDSTWQGEGEISLQKVESRMKAMEERILEEMGKKFLQLSTVLATIPKAEQKSGFFSARKPLVGTAAMGVKEDLPKAPEPPEGLLEMKEIKQMLDKFFASQETLQQSMESMKEKIDLLMGGETEANKLIDSIVPTLTTIQTQMKTFGKRLDEVAEKQDKGMDNLQELVKDAIHEAVECRDLCKVTSTDMDHVIKDVKDLKDRAKKIEKTASSNNSHLKDLESLMAKTTASRKRKNSESESRSRSRSSRSRSGSRGKRRDSRRSKKYGRSSRDTSISSVQVYSSRAARENDFEKLLVQIHDSIGVLSDKIDKNNADARVVSTIQQTVVPHLLKILESQEKQQQHHSLLVPPSKWDDVDASPSPPRKPSSSAAAALVSIPLPPPAVKSTPPRDKRKRKRSASSSSSSSDDEDRSGAVKKFGARMSQIEERLKEMGKAWKRNSNRMEDNSKNVMDRIGEITMGVQVIAENLDNINDVTRKIDNIDELKQTIEKLEGVPARLKRLDLVKDCLDRLDIVEHKLDSAVVTKDVVSKLSELEQLLVVMSSGPTAGGRQVTSDEYSDVSSLLRHLEEENAKKFCEFGGLVESLQEDIVKTLERVGTGGGSDSGGEKHHIHSSRAILDLCDKLLELVKGVEKNQTKDIIPSLTSLLALGGVSPGTTASSLPPVATPPLPSSSSSPLLSPAAAPVPLPTAGSISWDHKMAALTIQLSQLQPKLDDLYIKVLPKIEETQSRVRKLEENRRLTEEKVRLSEQEDRDHIQRILDIVEDLKEERGGAPASLDRRLVSLGQERSSLVDCEILLTAHSEKLDQLLKASMDIRGSLDIKKQQQAPSQQEEQLGQLAEDLKSMSGTVNSLLDNVRKDSKQLDLLLKNSSTDCKLLSSCNTSLQSMKASMNGVNTTVKDVKEMMGTLEERLQLLTSTANSLESKLQEEIVAQTDWRNSTNSSSTQPTANSTETQLLLEQIQPALVAIQSRLSEDGLVTEPVLERYTTSLLEALAGVRASVVAQAGNAAASLALLEGLDRAKMPESLENLGKSVTVIGVKLDISAAGSNARATAAGGPNAAVKREAETTTSPPPPPASSDTATAELSLALTELGKDLRSQLDDVHDMVANVEENTSRVLGEVRADMKAHDKLTGVSINNVAQYMKKILDLVKQVADSSSSNQAAEKRIIKAVEETLYAANGGDRSDGGQLMGEILVKLEGMEERERTSVADQLAALKRLEAGTTKIEQVAAKQEKMVKLVGRIKYLLEKEEGGAGDKSPTAGASKSARSANNNRKPDSAKADLTALQSQITELKDTVADELNNQSDMLTDLTNNLQDLSDKIATREVVRVLGDELRARLVDLTNCLTQVNSSLSSDLPDQLVALEENLSASVVAALRDEGRKHVDQLLDAIEDLEKELHGVKKAMRRSGAAADSSKSVASTAAGGAATAGLSLEGVMERLGVVAARLETLQAAVEAHAVEGGGVTGHNRSCAAEKNGGSSNNSLGIAVVLAEVRKRADSDSLAQLSSDMFKVVHNLQRRLLEEHKRLLNKLSESRIGQLDPSTVQLIEALNKVRGAQSDILSKQEGAVTLQTETNRLLQVTVENLEETRKLVIDGTEDGGPMTARFADLCEELAQAVSGVLALQDKMAATDTDGLQTLDGLVQTASALLRQQQRQQQQQIVGGKRVSTTSRRRKRTSRSSRRANSSSLSSGDNSEEMEDDREEAWEPPEVRLPHVFISKVGLTKEQKHQLEQVVRRRSGSQDPHQEGERGSGGADK